MSAPWAVLDLDAESGAVYPGASRSAAEGSPGFLAGLARIIRSRWTSWELPGSPEREELDFILLGHSATRNKVVLAVSRSTREALVVAKVARRLGPLGDRLREEHDILATLQRKLDPAFRASVPEPLYYGLCWGERVHLQRALPGRPLWELIGQCHTWGSGGRIRPKLVTCASWILSLHAATRGRPRPLATFRGPGGAPLAEPLERVRRAHALSPLGRELVSQVEAELREAAETEVPGVCEHGDFWMGNVLVHGEGLAVVDWEDARAEGLPYMDLFMLLHAAAVLRRNPTLELGRVLRDYEGTHFGDTWVLDVARPALGQYAEALGLRQELARTLFPLFLARLATHEHRLTGRSGYLDRMWCACLEAFAERRTQFRWLDEIPTRTGRTRPGPG